MVLETSLEMTIVEVSNHALKGTDLLNDPF